MVGYCYVLCAAVLWGLIGPLSKLAFAAGMTTAKAARFTDTRGGIVFDNIIAPLPDAAGVPRGAVLFARDVTALTRARERAEAANRAKNVFLATMVPAVFFRGRGLFEKSPLPRPPSRKNVQRGWCLRKYAACDRREPVPIERLGRGGLGENLSPERFSPGCLLLILLPGLGVPVVGELAVLDHPDDVVGAGFAVGGELDLLGGAVHGCGRPR